MLYIIIFSIVAPQILLSSKTKLGEEKQNVSIACTATGQPQPDITWSKSDGALVPRRKGKMNVALTIYNVTKKDRGTYICKAENILGSVSDTVLLMVFSPLRFKVLSPRMVTPVIGSTLRLPCVAESELRMSITWTKDVLFSLILPPRMVTPVIGSTLRLPCVAESELRMSITWTKDVLFSLPVASNVLRNGTLVLINLKKSHQGSYTCKATNALATIKAKVKINSPPASSCSLT